MVKRLSYWSGSPERFELITRIQELKREELPIAPGAGYLRSDDNVIVNPVTGKEVPLADLRYARDHLQEIINSGIIREDRWAFLWYH